MHDRKNGPPAQRLTVRDYFMLVNMVLFFAAGGTLLYRAFHRNAAWLAYVMGALFIFAGGYRFYLFYHALKGEK